MQDVNVVVVFDASDGETEKLALAAAVGAVQGRANIRLRRLPESADSIEYVAPREADALWADAVISGWPAGCGLEALEAFAAGKLVGKVGSALHHGAKNQAIYAAMCNAGFITVPVLSAPVEALECARMQGRRVAEVARALRKSGAV
jgi:hypothetical protein